MFCNDRLIALRKIKKLLQKEMAQILQMEKSTYAKYETGANQPPLDIVVKLSKFFEVSTDYLLGTSDIMNSNGVQDKDYDKILLNIENKKKLAGDRKSLEKFLAQYKVTKREHIQMVAKQIELMAKVEFSDELAEGTYGNLFKQKEDMQLD